MSDTVVTPSMKIEKNKDLTILVASLLQYRSQLSEHAQALLDNPGVKNAMLNVADGTYLEGTELSRDETLYLVSFFAFLKATDDVDAFDVIYFDKLSTTNFVFVDTAVLRKKAKLWFSNKSYDELTEDEFSELLDKEVLTEICVDSGVDEILANFGL